MSETPSPPIGRARLIVGIVTVAFFMENLDSTIIVTALPKMADSFHVSPVALSLSITVYLLTVAVLTPASGWIADRLGPRNVFAAAIGLFTVASILCGFSPGLWALVGARVLQGVAGAMLTSVGRLIALQNTQKSQLVSVMNMMSIPFLIGPVIGLPLGGFITTFVGWRWTFFLNVPIGLLGLALVMMVIPNRPSLERRAFDLPGLLFNALALGLLILGMEVLGQGGQWALGAALVAAAAGFGYVAVRHGLRAVHPIVDLSALRVPTFAVSTLTGGGLLRLGLMAPTLVLPLLLQVGMGYTAALSSLVILAMAGGDLLVKAVTTRTIALLGFRKLLVISGLGFAALTALCGLIDGRMPFWAIIALLFVTGAVRSFQMTGLTSLQFVDVTGAQMTGASTLAAISQQATRAVGIALAAFSLNLAAIARGGQSSRLEMNDYRIAFVVAALLILASVWWFARLPPGAGAHVSGHKSSS